MRKTIVNMAHLKSGAGIVLSGALMFVSLVAVPARAADMTTLTGTLAFASTPTSSVIVSANAVASNPTDGSWAAAGSVPDVVVPVGQTSYALSVPSGQDYVMSAESSQFARTWGGGLHATGGPTWSQVKDGAVTASGGTVSAGVITLSMPAETTITGHVNLGGVPASQVTVMAHQVSARNLAAAEHYWDDDFALDQPTTATVTADGGYSLTVDSGYSYLLGAKSYYYQESFLGGYSGSSPMLSAVKNSLLPAGGSPLEVQDALSLSLPGGALSVSGPTGYELYEVDLTAANGGAKYDCKPATGPVCTGVAPGVYVAEVQFQLLSSGSWYRVHEGTVVAVHAGVTTQLVMPATRDLGNTAGHGTYGTATTSVTGLPARAGLPLVAVTALVGAVRGISEMDYFWTDGTDVLGKGASFTPSGVEVGRPLSVVSVYGDYSYVWDFQVTPVGTVATGSVPASVSVGLRASTSNGRVYRLAGVPAGFTATSVAWYRSGKLVKGKTATYYRVSKKDVGKTLKAKTTLTQVGFTSKRVTTPKVKMGKLSPVVTVSKLKAKRVKVKVKVYSVKKPSGVVKVKWGSRGWRTYLLSTRSKGVLKVKAKAGFKRGQVKAVYQPRTKAAKKYIAKKTSKPLAVKY
jgi:hypothetical protein